MTLDSLTTRQRRVAACALLWLACVLVEWPLMAIEYTPIWRSLGASALLASGVAVVVAIIMLAVHMLPEDFW